MRSKVKDLALTAFAVVTSVLTAYLLALVDTNVHFAIYGYTLWLVIPIGAAAGGFVAATGHRIGFRRFPHRPTWLLMCNGVVLSIATYFLVYYWDYSMLQVRGIPISHYLSFGGFLLTAIENRQIFVEGAIWEAWGRSISCWRRFRLWVLQWVACWRLSNCMTCPFAITVTGY